MNYIPINLTNGRAEDSKKLERIIGALQPFKYTSEVNMHVIFDFKSPTNILGKYDEVIFIDVPYRKGNFSVVNGRSLDLKTERIYINSLAIAIRTLEEPDVIDCDDTSLFTEEGCWDYQAEIETDRAALRRFVHNNIDTVKHFDIAIVYKVNAPNCTKQYSNDVMYFNTGIRIDKMIGWAIKKTYSMQSTDCLLLKDGSKSAVWSSFVKDFIEVSEKHTQQGILTKKKVDSITSKNSSRLLERANDAIGNKLCIIGGKAGTGKTMALLRIMYNQVKSDADSKAHHCRLLTFNNMLVMDLKQAMKGIGDFTATNASISSLHKFFFDIYQLSPVRLLHMNESRIDEIFALCYSRVAKYNAYLQEENSTKQGKGESKDQFSKDDKAEICQYEKYINELIYHGDYDIHNLQQYAKDYVARKKSVFIENYNRQAFLNGYELIIEQLYLMFHNQDEFINKYGMKTAYTKEELRMSEQFKYMYEDLYERFIKDAEDKFSNEALATDDLVQEYKDEIEVLDEILTDVENPEEECREQIKEAVKKIKRKVNWSKYILVDEAQDCSMFEKALLLELNGSDDTVIASGGKDQLIRTPHENDWSQCFGHPLDVEKITLRNVSYRQKGNIVKFLNAFADAFKLNTELSVSDEMAESGRVIIDCRSSQGKSIPLDIVSSLYQAGLDYGCSNFENMMFLFPQSGYVKREESEDIDVVIDKYYAVSERRASAKRRLGISMPDYLNIVDATVNDKRDVLASVGQDNTRCLLYESCRGLEAWNVMCIDLDEFYHNKLSSSDAGDYASEHAGNMFEADRMLYIQRYAALWCYMAMTRAIDTLYIKLTNAERTFSKQLLETAKTVQNVEILTGPMPDLPVQDSLMNDETDE